jgi:hypothetical protein
MLSLVSPNRRIFDELSRGKLAMSAATFADYLAKDSASIAELLISTGDRLWHVRRDRLLYR